VKVIHGNGYLVINLVADFFEILRNFVVFIVITWTIETNMQGVAIALKQVLNNNSIRMLRWEILEMLFEGNLGPVQTPNSS